MPIKTLIESPNGAVRGVNRKRLGEMPYFLLTNRPNNTINMNANQPSGFIPMSISGEGPGEVVAFTHEKTDICRCFIQMQDGENYEGIMNRSIHVDTMFGNGLRPYKLAEALYIDERRSLIATFTDISGAANTIRPVGITSRYLNWHVDPGMERIRGRHAERQYLSKPFFYTFDEGPITIPANGTVQAAISVGQDHHFKLHQLSGVATAGLGSFTINIIEVNKGESIVTAPQMVNYQIRSDLIVGTAQFPFKFHEPILIETRSKLIVFMTDTSGADNVVDLTLHGQAIYLRDWRP